MTRKNTFLSGVSVLLLSAQMLFGIDNLKLNTKLDYQSDSLDGALITGDDAQSGFVAGKVNYVIIYGEGCLTLSGKRVELWNSTTSTATRYTSLWLTWM